MKIAEKEKVKELVKSILESSSQIEKKLKNERLFEASLSVYGLYRTALH